MPKQTEQTDANAEAQKILAEGKARQAEAVRLQEERDQATPTPTQDENDLAKLGALNPDDKQDSGAQPDPVATPPAEMPGQEADAAKRAAASEGGAAYRNRAAKTE